MCNKRILFYYNDLHELIIKNVISVKWFSFVYQTKLSNFWQAHYIYLDIKTKRMISASLWKLVFYYFAKTSSGMKKSYKKVYLNENVKRIYSRFFEMCTI